MNKWLESFIRFTPVLCIALGIIGTVSLIAALVFTLAGTGSITTPKEPLVWLGVATALYSLVLGCLSVHLSYSSKSTTKLENIHNNEQTLSINSINTNQTTGSCYNCGFLGKLRTQIDAETYLYEATQYNRETGNLTRYSGWPDQRDIPTKPSCFINATNLQKELIESLKSINKPTHADEIEHTLLIIKKSRCCEHWYPWTEYRTPKEHYDELKSKQLEDDRRLFESSIERQNKEERKRTNRVMIGLTIAALVFSLVQIYTALASINPNHWLFDWLR